MASPVMVSHRWWGKVPPKVKHIEIPDIADDRVMVHFMLPAKGRKPVRFSLPRRDYLAPGHVKLLLWLFAELDFDRSKVEMWVDPDEPAAVEKAVVLMALKPHLSDAQFKVLRECSIGQLRFINERWNEQSSVTLGEYWASADSSTSTERPSKQTSSTDTGTSGTSDEA